MSEIKYWYHPESDCLLDVGTEMDEKGAMECVELSEYDYVKKQIELIDADPEHKLPEGVTAILKLAYVAVEAGIISGAIWYDQNNRFPNGEMVTTSRVMEKLPGGLYRTRNSLYLVEAINLEPKDGTNG